MMGQAVEDFLCEPESEAETIKLLTRMAEYGVRLDEGIYRKEGHLPDGCEDGYYYGDYKYWGVVDNVTYTTDAELDRTIRTMEQVWEKFPPIMYGESEGNKFKVNSVWDTPLGLSLKTNNSLEGYRGSLVEIPLISTIAALIDECGASLEYNGGSGNGYEIYWKCNTFHIHKEEDIIPALKAMVELNKHL